MVFQRAALFPHLDVFENIAFGLRIAGIAEGEVGDAGGARRSRLVRLDGLRAAAGARALRRADAARRARPRARQPTARAAPRRAALGARPADPARDGGRAPPRAPRDRRDVRLRHARPGRGARRCPTGSSSSTSGRIEQVGTPDEIYRRPASPFAARFVGDANVIPVDVVERNGTRATVGVAGSRSSPPCDGDQASGPAWLVVRPEVVRLGDPLPAASAASCSTSASAARASRAGSQVEGLDEPLKAELPAESGAAPALGCHGRHRLGRGIRLPACPARSTERRERCSSTSSSSAAGQESRSRRSTSQPDAARRAGRASTRTTCCSSTWGGRSAPGPSRSTSRSGTRPARGSSESASGSGSSRRAKPITSRRRSASRPGLTRRAATSRCSSRYRAETGSTTASTSTSLRERRRDEVAAFFTERRERHPA